MKNVSAINTQDHICIPCSTEIISPQKTALNLYNYNLQLLIICLPNLPHNWLFPSSLHSLFGAVLESHFLSVHVSWRFRSVNVGVNKPFIPRSAARFLIYIHRWGHETRHIFLDVLNVLIFNGSSFQRLPLWRWQWPRVAREVMFAPIAVHRRNNIRVCFE